MKQTQIGFITLNIDKAATSCHDRHTKKTTNTTAIGAAAGLAQTYHGRLGVA